MNTTMKKQILHSVVSDPLEMQKEFPNTSQYYAIYTKMPKSYVQIVKKLE